MSLPVSIERVEPSRGTVVIAHGLGEHSGRYAHVVRSLSEAGWSVVTTASRSRTPLTVAGPGAGPEVTAAGLLAEILEVVR